jgi:hypothetical protein
MPSPSFSVGGLIGSLIRRVPSGHVCRPRRIALKLPRMVLLSLVVMVAPVVSAAQDADRVRTGLALPPAGV